MMELFGIHMMELFGIHMMELSGSICHKADTFTPH